MFNGGIGKKLNLPLTIKKMYEDDSDGEIIKYDNNENLLYFKDSKWEMYKHPMYKYNKI